MDVFNLILGILLFLISVRGISTEYFHFDNSKRKWVRILFAKSEEITARRILKALGYENYETDLFRYNARKNKPKTVLLQLIDILKKSTSQYKDDVIKFGSHKSEYYIDTMGAAHDPYICDELNSILWQLIRKKEENVDFVFSPKDSNINLLLSFDKAKDEIFSIVAKSVHDKSLIKGKDDDPICARVNFEGLQFLMTKAKSHNRKLTGIAVTCNVSNGSSMLDCILRFNRTLAALNEVDGLSNVNPITKLFVLYRAVSDPKMDELFEKHGIVCYRFFDLTEAKKHELYNMRINTNIHAESFSCYKCISDGVGDCGVKHCWKHI